MTTTFSDARFVANELKKITGDEHGLCARFLVTLLDVSERGLHLELGFKNMFEFCLSLGLSESCSYKRIAACGVVKRFPVVLDFIKDGKLHLSHICLLSSVLTNEKHVDLFSKCSGQSKRFVECLVAGLKEPVPIKPVSQLKIFSPQPNVQSTAQLDAKPTSLHPIYSTSLPAQTPGVEFTISLFSDSYDPTPKPDFFVEPKAILEPNAIFAAELRLTCGKELLDLINRAKNLTSTKDSDLELLMTKVFEEFVSRHAPEKKEQRSAARQDKKEQKSESKTDDNNLKTEEATAQKPMAVRFIPEKTKRSVMLAADSRCSYASQDGKRCSATSFLQFDHVRPVGFGGSNEPENIRVLFHVPGKCFKKK